MQSQIIKIVAADTNAPIVGATFTYRLQSYVSDSTGSVTGNTRSLALHGRFATPSFHCR